ncbi:MAG: lipocalin family protein [Bacteroidaceae bacterium]|nr:lipocalin family protein [Bacteroidaceae bacterium]
MLSFVGLMTGATCKGSLPVKIDNSTVSQLDVPRFMGKWYEIARYEHRFERGMTHVTAEYTLLDDGKIGVVNRGEKDNEPREITGKARRPHPTQYPGRLEVSFFLWFYSDYYVLELSPDYEYAVIGSSSDKYLWILCRRPHMSQSTLEHILDTLTQRGYDTSLLTFVSQ